MKGIVLNTYEEMLLALLRASLFQKDIEKSFFEKVSPNDWKQCYQLAVQHGVMALAWDGVLKLPVELLPPKALKLTWGISVELYEKKYQKYCQASEELITFYREHDIATVILKGIGLSSLYPIPAHREGGDIDIYTYSANKDKLTDREANLLADKLMQQQGIDVDVDHSSKHSSFYYNGIPIENHRTFIDIDKYLIAPQVNELLDILLNPKIICLERKYKMPVPSSEFDTIFIAFHAAQHYGSGMVLHHLCDWAVLISKYGVQLHKELTDKNFLEGIAAFTYLCNLYLGTSVKIKGGERLATEIMETIMHPKFVSKNIPSKNKIKILIYKFRRLMYISKLSNRILYMPFWRRIYISIIMHIRHPEIIFHRG